MFQNALEFSGVKARDIMSPRTEQARIVWLYSRTERIIHRNGLF
jgi:CBS domain containing-hemolysin-like protein